jgi:hypothetical protein
MGRVAIWGRMVEGTDDYRAHYAKGVAFVMDELERFARVLRHYRISVEPLRTPIEEGFSRTMMIGSASTSIRRGSTSNPTS